MYEFKTAYRYDNGQIEGFTGIGSTERAAENDCYNQIIKKLNKIDKTIKPENIIKSFKGLNKEQQENIKKDWKCHVRY